MAEEGGSSFDKMVCLKQTCSYERLAMESYNAIDTYVALVLQPRTHLHTRFTWTTSILSTFRRTIHANSAAVTTMCVILLL